ncbi:cellulase, partial [candidate division KSB1 bacterium]|nr:cellulase [candidate division KSB1 bacterium]
MKEQHIHPRAITIWDFSWLERRWPGAGYEDWDQALDELKDRGYDAVRIDAYPHLLSEDAQKTWTLNEVWNTQMWGSPDVVNVRIQPELNQFIAKCRERGIKVGLSSWFRQDVDNTRMKIDSPEKMADIWIK